MSEFEDRRSKPDPAELIADPLEKAQREAENGIRQFEAALALVRHYTDGKGRDDQFSLTQELICEFHRLALDGIHAEAGRYRRGWTTIRGSQHVPPLYTQVSDLVVQMCDYVNEYWYGLDEAELAAYVLWRLNWIHPFTDGNGRTARTVAYAILSLKLGYVLPGSPTIPDQIAADKAPYYRYLEEADDSWKREIVALSGLEKMLETMLEQQLRSATSSSSG